MFPRNISVFVDLFGGSGIVSLNTRAEHIIYNDIVPYVTEIMEGIKNIENIDEFVNNIKQEMNIYGLDKVDKDAFDRYRDLYNKSNEREWWKLYLLMCHSFNSQFRFNSNHEYNSSFGHDRCRFRPITEEKLRHAKERIDKLDIIFTKYSFEDFDFSEFDENDFVYLDPPYYGSVGNYNDGKRGFKGWNLDLENKMRNLCVDLDKKGVKFALSNNFAVNTTLDEWAKINGFNVVYMDLNYSNSNYQKKAK